jgi:hypothetical protein
VPVLQVQKPVLLQFVDAEPSGSHLQKKAKFTKIVLAVPSVIAVTL